MPPVVQRTHVALATFVVALLGVALPIEAEEQVDLGSRLRLLDACFGTKLTEAHKDNRLGKEAGEMLVKLFKAEDLFQRISCLEARELEQMMAENKDSSPSPYKLDTETAKTAKKMNDWDRVRELDACLQTDYAGANKRGEKEKARAEYNKMKKALILAPDLLPFTDCMENREDEN